MYGCNSVSILGVMNGSRFFVLKTRWTRTDDSDCDIFLRRAFSAPCLFQPRNLGRRPRLLHFAPLARRSRLSVASDATTGYCLAAFQAAHLTPLILFPLTSVRSVNIFASRF